MKIIKIIFPRMTVLLILTVLLASFFPIHGRPAEAFSLATNAAIALLFFLHGAKLCRRSIYEGIGHWRLHILVFSTTFLFFPVLIYVSEPLISRYAGEDFYLGFLYLSVLPATVQSSIAFTSMARGNISAAICSASGSSILGVFITPLLVALLLDTAHGGMASVDVQAVIKIFGLLLLPFCIGHWLRPKLLPLMQRYPGMVRMVDQGSILMVVYSAFSQEVTEGLWQEVPLETLVNTALISAIILFAALLFTWSAGRLLGFNRADTIAIVFCGSKKSLANGLPMARVLFPGLSLGPLILPIMIFHQIQLMVCAWIAEILGRQRPDQ